MADSPGHGSTDGAAVRRRAFREALGDGVVAALFSYWEEKAAGAEMPQRSAIDPIEIPHLLPTLYMLEPLGDGAFRFRLAGTGVRELFDAEVTGRRVDEVLTTPELRENARRSYETLMRERRPWLTRTEYELNGGETVHYRRLALPLGQDGVVERILGAFEIVEEVPAAKPFHLILPEVARVLDRREIAG